MIERYVRGSAEAKKRCSFSDQVFLSKTLSTLGRSAKSEYTARMTELKSLTLEDLAAEASEIRARLNRFRTSLGRFFVERQHIIDLMVVSAVAREPLLLVGVPGTAKSELVTKFRDALGVNEEDYFEYLLTRFTEPSEVMGPIDIKQLREGRFVRRIGGRLPDAKLVFLDEVFKSNSAILNALLTVINERKYYQDGQPVKVPLEVLFGATNEIPEHAELGALRDRFALKVICHSVQDDHFIKLIDAGLDGQTHKETNARPWVEGHATLDDVLRAGRYLTLTMANQEETRDGKVRDRDRFFPEEVMREFRRVLKTIRREDEIFVSDRRVVKLYRLLRTRAWLFHGGRVERDDLRLLAHLGETREELALLEEKVPKLLGL